MRVLLDTHVLIQADVPGGFETFPRKVQALLADPETERLVSAVSLVEIAIKNTLGKLKMTQSEAGAAIRNLRLTVMPLSPQHALSLFALPLAHADPFDRMLIATALSESVPLVSGDRQFKRYKGLEVVW